VADMLATKEELASFMQDNAMDASTATLILQLATGEVQAAAGQRLLQVVDDPFEIEGDRSRRLSLPERPVTDVSSLTIDGGDELVAGTDYTRTAGSASLWRRCGWARCIHEPSTVAGLYTHGYEVGDQALQPARAATLAIGRAAYSNPSGLTSEAIDDYRAAWGAAVVSAMENAPYLAKSLRRRYGARAGLVRVGG
jgi:hypothetical protein